ncbi:MAG TPA: TonB-dependent receptor plug domain-containing protein, partial [Candidatus Baltobacteraceae bacterium]
MTYRQRASLRRITGVAIWAFSLLIALDSAAPADDAKATMIAGVQSASLDGVAIDAKGTPVGGIVITLYGPQRYSTPTSRDGHFAIIDVLPGLYTLRAARPGAARPVAEQEYVALAGESSTLTIAIEQPQTSSDLKEIGHTSTHSGATINITPAATTGVTAQTFTEQGAVNVRRVLEELPGVTVQPAGGSGSYASQSVWGTPAVRGSLDQETQVLLDGLPITTGTGGANPTNFFNAYTLSGIRVVEGPGATLSQLESAINGAVDFQTLEPAAHTSGSFTIGDDGLGGSLSNYLFTGRTFNDKLGFVFDYAINGTPGSLTNGTGYINLPATAIVSGKAVGTTTAGPANAASNGIQNNPSNATSSLVAYGLGGTQQYLSKTTLAKITYAFSNATSAKVTFLNNYSNYDNNGRNITEFESQFAPGAAYTAPAGGPS